MKIKHFVLRASVAAAVAAMYVTPVAAQSIWGTLNPTTPSQSIWGTLMSLFV